MSVAKPTRDGFLENVAKLQQAKKNWQSVAMKAAAPGANKDAMNAQKLEMKFNINNMIGIVGRQYSTGIWKQASPGYVQKFKERRDLEAEYAKLTGTK